MPANATCLGCGKSGDRRYMDWRQICFKCQRTNPTPPEPGQELAPWPAEVWDDMGNRIEANRDDPPLTPV